MMTKMWIALALGATMMVGGVATVTAFDDDKGDGDCLRDCLKDGSCEDGTSDALGEESTDGVCDSCNEYLYDWDFLYLEPGPHQSACGQE